ncbi:MAG: hypothetical protein LBP22_00905 [Deltaproteobacteria bacterium]|jgi:hypothetical protein|nr:hypothetical protein [Deltaproteobacteria bacterium]
MLTFAELERRLRGLVNNLDGELWPGLLQKINPPQEPAPGSTLHDLAFRDAKALAGYAPDLRAIIQKTSPRSLPQEELTAVTAIKGLFNLMARLPVLLLTIEEHRTNQNLIDVYNGYRQILLELDQYLTLAAQEKL